MPAFDRCCDPHCTIRLYFRAASTAWRPTQISCEIGFSTYTSLPAWQPQTTMSECQWFGVAVTTQSTFLSSNTFRTSWYPATLMPFASSRATCPSSTLRSQSHRAVTRTPFMPANAEMCALPRPPNPTTATRMSSFAPKTRAYGRPNSTTPAAIDPARNSLRFILIRRLLPQKVPGPLFPCSWGPTERPPPFF